MRERRMGLRRAKERAFLGLFLLAVGIALASLGSILFFITLRGLPYLQPSLFLNPVSSQSAARAGIRIALISSAWVVGLTLLISLPLGIGAGVYLQEYGSRSRLARYLETGVANLAGVPSVVFGLLGLGLFVQLFGMGEVVLAGALTLSILVFPYVVIATEEAVAAVPQSIRDAALALGATKWQTTRQHVLPAAAPGILTGAILSASRAIGETAPLIVIGATALQFFAPTTPFSFFQPLPVVIFGWATDARPEFQGLAAAASIVFLGIVILLNLTAVVLRSRYQRRW